MTIEQIKNASDQAEIKSTLRINHLFEFNLLKK